MRRVVGASWQVLKIVPPLERSYNDASIVQQTEYEYRIVAVDSVGLRSEPSVVVRAHTYEQGLKQAITGLTARFDSTSGNVVLQWQYTSSAKNTTDKEWFIIYRASDDEPLEQYEAVQLPVMTFRDRVRTGASRTYRYAVSATNGRVKSPLTTEISLRVP